MPFFRFLLSLFRSLMRFLDVLSNVHTFTRVPVWFPLSRSLTVSILVAMYNDYICCICQRIFIQSLSSRIRLRVLPRGENQLMGVGVGLVVNPNFLQKDPFPLDTMCRVCYTTNEHGCNAKSEVLLTHYKCAKLVLLDYALRLCYTRMGDLRNGDSIKDGS